MKGEGYNNFGNKDKTVFKFISLGEKGAIEKRVEFTPVKEALNVPELREVALKMQREEAAIRSKPFRTKKFRLALEFASLRHFHQIVSEHPDWPLKDVLSDILKGFNPEIPPDMILEMTQLIIREWEKSGNPQSGTV